MVRALYRPGREQPQPGIRLDTRAPDKDTPSTRDQIGAFLDAALMRPLWSSNAEWDAAIDQSLNTITYPERVMIELEMQERQKAVHSFDYDPLR